MNQIIELAIFHIEHGHLPILLSGLMRLISLFPLILILVSVTKTFIDKLHFINGLRPYRIAMMVILLAAIIDQLIFLYFNTLTFFSNVSNALVVDTRFLLFNSIVTLFAYSFLLFLFLHASKKDATDSL